MPPTNNKLTAKQAAFVSEYMIDRNATQAAIRSGYSKKTASAIGKENLRKPLIAEAIAAAEEELAERNGLSADKVIQELALLGFANMDDYIKRTEGGDVYVDLANLTREQAAAIQEIVVETYQEATGGGESREVKRTKFKLADKRASLVDLGRHFGVFIDRKELTGPNGGPIQHETITQETSPEEAARIYREQMSAG